jgi:flagellar protein FlaG
MSTITPMGSASADMVPAPATPPAPAPISSSANAATGTPQNNGTATTGATQTAPQMPPDTANAAQRLVIQAGAQTGVFIYTILDRATGQVMVQIPREEVLRLANRPDYSAGAVIDTKA